MEWINKYIGLPFKPNGRTLDGVDCYGLVKMILFDVKGWELPDWVVEEYRTETVLQTIRRGLADAKNTGSAFEVKTPEDFDVVFVSRSSFAEHIGLVIGNKVLHISQQTGGSVFENMQRFLKSGNGKIRFYRWQQ